ncbi:hypothetical protein [Chondromyces crocatus]|nr:hypothetical protein [Chondromyces crocatus]
MGSGRFRVVCASVEEHHRMHALRLASSFERALSTRSFRLPFDMVRAAAIFSELPDAELVFGGGRSSGHGALPVSSSVAAQIADVANFLDDAAAPLLPTLRAAIEAAIAQVFTGLDAQKEAPWLTLSEEEGVTRYRYNLFFAAAHPSIGGPALRAFPLSLCVQVDKPVAEVLSFVPTTEAVFRLTYGALVFEQRLPSA